ncbi:hypothetical protein Mesil_3627 (plasmid) [Allomeiothermus silvanus DSM 9946]|uniref:Uncharacterized protein n=1 Tax=Allomeiothermus silvanus (strain ATCC 700542 / DSM 9946 / NBRC 106475 / NCIMB 13440 / VI-R2) TaxID=526227 RepID=D7BJR1_ALLS1|nr:hypothetical protein [Allomeiothermus silvanus]ADH65417.1 hypothetical protein Mesil_3627 [Allomeiothermus silvanus DSM 9946]
MRFVVLILGLWMSLALAAGGNSSGSNSFSLDDGIQIIQTLSDPTQYVEYFPDTDRWIPWFGQRMREYKVPIILYNLGLMLLLAGLALLVLQIFSGRQSLAEVLLRLVLVGVGWQLLVLPPSKNGCTAGTENSYPCTVDTSTKQVDKPVLEPDGNGGYQVKTKTIAVVQPNAPELESHRLVKTLFKDVMLAGANSAIIASLKNEGQSIKKAQEVITNLTLIAWSAAGTANLAEAAPVILRCGAGGLIGALNGGGLGGAASGCVSGSGAPEVARSVAGTLGTARSLLVMGPMLAIATFHAVNTLAGLYLYSVLFFMPLLIPLVLFGGTSILAGASRLALVALVTPLISGVLLSTGMGLSYSYSRQKFDELQTVADDLKKAGIPLGAAGFALTGSSLASVQLYNLYQCLQADRESQGSLLPLKANALCDERVSFDQNGSVTREYQQILNEQYGKQQPSGVTASGRPQSEVVMGQAFRRVIERATPQFSGVGLWSNLAKDTQDQLYRELDGLFKSGDGASLAGNVKAMLDLFKRYQAQPDFGERPLYAVLTMTAAEGMTGAQGDKVVQGLREVAFKASNLPPNSFLEAKDTWADGSELLGLLNRLYAAEESQTDFQSKVMASLRSKMLNMVILMLTAIAITIVMLGTITQLIGQLLMAGMAAGNAGLQMFMGSAALNASRESVTGGVFRGMTAGGGGGRGMAGESGGGGGRGISTGYPAGPAPRP